MVIRRTIADGQRLHNKTEIIAEIISSHTKAERNALQIGQMR